jgi:signal transduction histidine kinase/DNA-binding response OmpR family regulator
MAKPQTVMTAKLLVIDDDEIDRLLLKRALRSTDIDFQLTEFDNPDGILDCVSQTPYDCIFLDYLLPGVNGLALLQSIRDRGIKTPVVIITSQGNERIAVELMKAGASDYIVKNNINSQTIGHVVRNMIRVASIERDRETAELALKISEARLAEAQRIAKIGNWEVNPTDKCSLYWSPEVYNIFEVQPDEFTPTLEGCLNFIHHEDIALIKQQIKATRTGTPFNVDIRIANKARLKYIHVQGHVLRNSESAPEKIVGTIQDITERKLAEREILTARELAESSMKVREIFLANMSHEIRTPMNAILGFTRLMQETPLNAEQKKFVEAILFSGDNLLVIINDILDLSKIKSGKMVLDKCDFNLHELIRGVITLLEPKSQEKNLQFLHTIDASVPRVVFGDPVRLNQILVNLISNAIKFTSEGYIKLELKSVGLHDNGHVIEFSVHDTGLGIPQDKQGRIFESFEQATGDTTRKYGGTGLGLAIVKSIVELQEGTITLMSSPGNGSNFTVRLPYDKPFENKIHTEKTDDIDREATELVKGASILLVEDNELNRLLAVKSLQKSGCIVDTAENGKIALDKLQTGKYDVILMDIQMPELDGYDTTRYIRETLQEPLASIPIIAMTAHAFSSDVNKCLSVGMNDYISKPFKQNVLLSKIAGCLKKNSNPDNALPHPETAPDLKRIAQ